MQKDYNETLTLPKTDFPMRGNLPKREPEVFEGFYNNNLHEKIQLKNKGKPKYILHDGPPYANGDIHLGTALNKVLKDIIVKQKNMTGYDSPYVPGWDTHGLPIELKAIKKLKLDKNTISPIELREKCKEYALKYVELQKSQFKRLGVIGDFDNPYLTLLPEFEAKQVEIFGKMANDGCIYRGLKPVYWCYQCNTALAEAEIEYSNDYCKSAYIKFKVSDDNNLFQNNNIDKSKVYFVIWTTTLWTIPANVAICLGSDFKYSLVKVNDEYLVIASELLENTMKVAGVDDYNVICEYTGKEFEYIKVEHPFLDRKSLVITGDHVTLDSGTGCVHTAPGHGIEDFEACKAYPDLKVVVPVNEKGILTEESGEFCGIHIKKSAESIVEKLNSTGNLLCIEEISHQYPHCWRCDNPVIFRATEQWFCSIKEFKDKAYDAIKSVNWIPKWGEDRMKSMVLDRSDWCISRQRIWGVPIPIIYCNECKKPLITPETINIVADLFKKYGSNAWYTKTVSEIFGDSIECDCKCKTFEKENDIMDVWFDSGVSHSSVLNEREELSFPADLYLEGHDQYRGWFQSSLLTSVAYTGVAPYKNICTHGWVVDGQGKKMSKSLGNGIEPETIIKEYGADILRLWAASSDYHADIRISKNILSQLSEGYRKIRNTSRFILGNLNDFDPNKDFVEIENLNEFDKWMLYKLNLLTQKVHDSYENLDFHIVYQSIRNFCVLDLSNFYLDIIKDRLYCDSRDSKDRRSSQSTIYIIIDTICRLLAPILPFTCEEIWKCMPHKSSDVLESVYLNDMTLKINFDISDKIIDKWYKIYDIRQEVQKAMEVKRAEKVIGSSLECEINLITDNNELFSFLQDVKNDLSMIFISSDCHIKFCSENELKSDIPNLSIEVFRNNASKCERCWSYKYSVGENVNNEPLCKRCFDVLY